MTKRKTPRAAGERPPASPRGKAPRTHWLWGGHAVQAALANPRRRVERLVLAAETAETWGPRLQAGVAARPDLPRGWEVMGRLDLERLIGRGAVHQGVALLATPAPQPDVDSLLDELPAEAPAVVVLLDQVSDPQNVGAVLRSAAAFGATAVITTERHAPGETGLLAKAASGGLDAVPFIHVTNLARTLEALAGAQFWRLGLAGAGGTPLPAEWHGPRTALVLGAEGSGLRRLTRERCDRLVRLPTTDALADLNVSNAAAVALYELLGRSAAGGGA